MSTLSRAAVLAAACSLLWSPVAFSQEDDTPTWWTSVFLGYAGSLEKNAPSGSFGGFVNGFAMVTPGIGLGAEGGHMRLGSDSTTWTPPEQSEERPVKLGRSAWRITGNVLARGRVGNFRPFINGGAGLYLMQTDASDPAYASTSSKSVFGFNVGGGAVYSGEGKNWGFGIDARWHDIIKGRLDGGDLDVISISAGFMFWGG